MEQFGTTINAQLMARRRGNYIVYVFKNLDTNAYITVTRRPNWDAPEIEVGEIGFLTYEFIIAYKDAWTNKTTGTSEQYLYTANYFESFIPNSHVISNSITLPKELLVK